MGSTITQPVRKFFSKDKVQQESSTINGDSSDNRENGDESSDDDSVPVLSNSEIASGTSTSTNLSSEDEEQQKPNILGGDSTELKNEVMENTISEKDDLWSTIDKYKSENLQKDLRVTSDGPQNKNEDSRPNIFELRYKSNKGECNEPIIAENVKSSQLELNTPPSEKNISESDPPLLSSQQPDSSKEGIPESVNSEIPVSKPFPSHTVLSDKVIHKKSPTNSNKPNSEGKYNKDSYYHNFFRKAPKEIRDKIWAGYQRPYKKKYTLRNNEKAMNIERNKKLNSSVLKPAPTSGVSVFTQLKNKREFSKPYSRNKVMAHLRNSENASLNDEAKFVKKSHLHTTYNHSLGVKKHDNVSETMPFQNLNPMPVGEYTLHNKPNERIRVGSQSNGVKNPWARHINVKEREEQDSYHKTNSKVDFDIYKFRYVNIKKNISQNPVNFRSTGFHTISKSTFKNKIPESERSLNEDGQRL